MAHEITWLVPDRVLHIRVWGEVSVEDAQAFSTEGIALMEASPQPKVHAMLDDTEVTGTSGGLKQFKDAVGLVYHEKAGWMMTIGVANPLITFLGATITRLMGARYRRFPTREDAVHFLKESDPELKAILESQESAE